MNYVPRSVQIFTLGRFIIMRDDAPLGENVTTKPLALLKALIEFGCSDIRRNN